MSVAARLVTLSQGGVGGGPTQLMRLCFFDWAVCAIAGQDEPVVRTLISTCESHGPCSVFGGATYDPATAALINGTMGHALDYDDTHFDHIGHTSAVVMPAVLAVAQDQMMDLNRVLEAALVGSEAAVRVGLWLGHDHYQVGYHQTATAGAFGAVVGLARLLRLDREQTDNAIGLTATMASGLKGQFGTMGKPLNAGLAARVAVEAVTWAKAGLTSDPQGLENFAATHHGQGHESAWDDAEPWKIARISHKFHACCHGLHAMLEALAQQPIDPEAIAVVRVYTHPRWMSVCNKPDPATGLEAKFSYRQTAAMAIAGISTAAIARFSDDIASDPELRALREKVEVMSDDRLSEMQARVVLTFADGRTETREHDLDAPLSLSERETRLRAKATAVLGDARAAALWDVVSRGDLVGLFDV
ncbi:2-methylcitrate dehydratase PrpD [Cognatiyoonia koreensis]|uniref:2-methylcitrate dehydratase PrpD n=1 Tax=Cognatiyoonia koreensis TaxID=364200 RepID=A0A1I0P2L5_9RHOB|nr:MmgE/PrpD family protein [Cognatiyoonia koreensis]SEW08423.1 2-methylcitrate dehydratase PrpD [Cognatiyoonia koreensis]